MAIGGWRDSPFRHAGSRRTGYQSRATVSAANEHGHKYGPWEFEGDAFGLALENLKLDA